MQRVLAIAVFIGLAYFFLGELNFVDPVFNETAVTDSVIAEAYESRRSDLQVSGIGEVTRILPDDVDGSRHQRFILRLESGQTILISHNIDLAPRISRLSQGDLVEFFGEFEWNEQGGVVHWTHRDPQGRHVAGWLKHQGATYQ